MNKLKKTITLNRVNDKPKLIISKDILSKIAFLHSFFKKTEWSGILFYNVEGSPSNLNEMEIRAENIYPMDVGTTASTNFEVGPEIMDVYDAYPELENCQYGSIHTHHSMTSFFSSTDEEDLFTNASLYNYYLSLIVNFEGTFNARLGFEGTTTKSEIIIKGNNGEPIPIKMKEKSDIYYAECQIIFEQDSFLMDRAKQIQKEANEKTQKAGLFTQHSPSYGYSKLRSYNEKNNKVDDYFYDGSLFDERFDTDISYYDEAPYWLQEHEEIIPMSLGEEILSTLLVSSPDIFDSKGILLSTIFDDLTKAYKKSPKTIEKFIKDLSKIAPQVIKKEMGPSLYGPQTVYYCALTFNDILEDYLTITSPIFKPLQKMVDNLIFDD